jgi:hypothetical protein
LKKHLSWRREGTIDGAFLFCRVVCDHVGAGLGKLLLRFIEGFGKIAFNIEFGGERFVH